MSTSANDLTPPRAVDVHVSARTLDVALSDGRTISVPISWFPRLENGAPHERANCQLMGAGEGVHWPELDEDISVEALLEGRASSETQRSLKGWLARRLSVS